MSLPDGIANVPSIWYKDAIYDVISVLLISNADVEFAARHDGAVRQQRRQ